MPKVVFTKRFERRRIRPKTTFIKGSFRVQDIGRKGFSKRLAGKLKKTGKFETATLLISRDEPKAMKEKLRASARAMLRRARKEKKRRKLKRIGV